MRTVGLSVVTSVMYCYALLLYRPVFVTVDADNRMSLLIATNQVSPGTDKIWLLAFQFVGGSAAMSNICWVSVMLSICRLVQPPPAQVRHGARWASFCCWSQLRKHCNSLPRRRVTLSDVSYNTQRCSATNVDCNAFGGRAAPRSAEKAYSVPQTS